MASSRWIGAVVGVSGILFVGPPAAFGSITDDFPITIDAAIDSRDPNENFGASTTAKVVVNGDDGSLVRALFSLPEDAWLIPLEQIQEVELHVYVWQDSTGSRTVDLHPLTRGFVEGTGDGTESGDGATWRTYDGVNAWSNPGGDFDTNTWVSATEATNWFVWDLLTLWDNDDLKDFGAILKMDDESNPGAGNLPRAPFTSSEGPVSEQPFLRVVYVPEPGTAALALLLTGLMAGRRKSRFL